MIARRVSNAIRMKVSRMRQLAFIVPRRLPDTFEAPPARRRCATGSSRMRKPAQAARICISRFQPYVSSRMPSRNSGSRRIARNGHISV